MRLKDFILSVFSSLLLILSFPSYDLEFLAWVGLLPLLVVINGKKPGQCFLLSLVSGIIFFLGIFHWILTVPNYTLLHHVILALYLGSYFGFFGLGFSLISIRLGIIAALFAAPFIWVSLEYLRSNLSFLSLPWALLAHSQYRYPVIIQIASLSGTYTISFLIVMVNSALVAVLFPILQKRKITDPSFNQITLLLRRRALIIPAATLLGLTLLYGYMITSQTIAGKEIKVSLIQGNIDQKRKWDLRYANDIMQTYAELTLRVAREGPALIVWPETATPGAINKNVWIYKQVKNIAKTAGTYLLLGSAQHQKFKVSESMGVKHKYMNSAYLISSEVKKFRNQRYDKIRLFPFGEYLPFKGVIPWSLVNIPHAGNYTPGEKFTVFEHPAFRFGVTICWENVFPDLVRQFVKRGAQLVINITNEAHFGKTSAPYQLVSISVFRAVENRVFVIRCANTGVSCLIDPYGRIIDRAKDETGEDIFIQGILSGLIIPLDSRTFYTKHGDWFAWLCLFCSAAFLLIAFSRNNPD